MQRSPYLLTHFPDVHLFCVIVTCFYNDNSFDVLQDNSRDIFFLFTYNVASLRHVILRSKPRATYGRCHTRGAQTHGLWGIRRAVNLAANALTATITAKPLFIRKRFKLPYIMMSCCRLLSADAGLGGKLWRILAKTDFIEANRSYFLRTEIFYGTWIQQSLM